MKLILKKFKKFFFLKKFQLVTTFIGTIGKTNDLDKVLEAAKLLRNKNMSISFVIAGKGENYSKLLKNILI